MKTNYLRMRKRRGEAGELARGRAWPEPPDPRADGNAVSAAPVAARTFADHGIAEAREICARRPDVIIREDPMFGRRGYAREVLFDAEEGYLVLVIAYTAKPDKWGKWSEPFKPKGVDRQFWKPGRVEFAP